MRKLERFFAKVAIGALDDCWPWLGALTSDGYGRCSRATYGDERANRVAFELWYGVRLGALQSCHTCDNPPCCNPLHLFAGTHSDNMQDAFRKGRRAGLFGAANPMYGRGDLLRGSRNPMYGRTGPRNPHFGKAHSEEAKRTISEKAKAYIAAHGPRIWTDEQRARMSAFASSRTGASNPFYGRRHSEETKRKMREAAARRKKGKQP